jgi:hypothetical protein
MFYLDEIPVHISKGKTSQMIGIILIKEKTSSIKNKKITGYHR